MKSKYPDPLNVTKELNKRQNSSQEAIQKILEDRILRTIQNLQLHKSAGPSGLGPKHLKYIAISCPIFVKKLAIVFNAILSRQDLFQLLPNMFKFRSVFIPKKDKDFRPIAI